MKENHVMFEQRTYHLANFLTSSDESLEVFTIVSPLLSSFH